MNQSKFSLNHTHTSRTQVVTLTYTGNTLVLIIHRIGLFYTRNTIDLLYLSASLVRNGTDRFSGEYESTCQDETFSVPLFRG